MADNKKSFILYADLIHTVKKMPDDKAGLLLKKILDYVNDLDPEDNDMLVDVVFEPIKQNMKRDLVKWEGAKEIKSTNGIIGNLKRWHADLYKLYFDNKITIEQALKIVNDRKVSPPDPAQSQSIAKVAVTVNENVTVNGIVNDNVIKDDVVVLETTSSLFTIHNFIAEVEIGENEFTLLAIRKTGRTVIELTGLLQDFIKEQKGLTKLTWQNAPDSKNHFINWVKKQPKGEKSRFQM